VSQGGDRTPVTGTPPASTSAHDGIAGKVRQGAPGLLPFCTTRRRRVLDREDDLRRSTGDGIGGGARLTKRNEPRGPARGSFLCGAEATGYRSSRRHRPKSRPDTYIRRGARSYISAGRPGTPPGRPRSTIRLRRTGLTVFPGTRPHHRKRPCSRRAFETWKAVRIAPFVRGSNSWGRAFGRDLRNFATPDAHRSHLATCRSHPHFRSHCYCWTSRRQRRQRREGAMPQLELFFASCSTSNGHLSQNRVTDPGKELLMVGL
jgi:hypothetical protein